MPLPRLEKTWQFAVNNKFAAGHGLTANQNAARIFVAIKDLLVGFDSNPWTVLGSSNSIAAGLDGADRFATYANVVGAAGAHSWIVLEQSATGLQVCFDFASSTISSAAAVLSVAAGFTGGSTTARPTAADEEDLNDSDPWINPGADSAVVFHVLHSEDGENTLVFALYGDASLSCTVRSHWMFGKAADPVTGWTAPYFGYARGSSSSAGMLADEFGDTDDHIKARGPSGSMPLRASFRSPGRNYADWMYIVQDSANALTGEWPLWPVILFSDNTGQKSWVGWLPDFWIASEALESGGGHTFPANGTRKFAQFGSYVVPWNGSVIVTPY